MRFSEALYALVFMMDARAFLRPLRVQFWRLSARFLGCRIDRWRMVPAALRGHQKARQLNQWSADGLG